jgi:DNA-binding MarR family transcriptional regulator
VTNRARMKRGKSAVGTGAITDGAVRSKEPSAKEWRKELLVFWFFNTCIRLQKYFDRRLISFRMTLQEASVLLHCVKARRITHGNLAIAIGRDAGKVTRFIRRLEAKRLVIQDGDRRDRRLSIIRPTAKGRTLAENLASALEGIREDLFASIEERDVHHAGQVLRKLYQNSVQIDSRKQKPSPGINRVHLSRDLASVANGSITDATETITQPTAAVPHQEFALK